MKKFKPLKNLEEVKNIQTGDIIGVEQLSGETIPALCTSHKGKRISLLGNMDNQVIIKYVLTESDIKRISYIDGSIGFCFNNRCGYVEQGMGEYNSLKTQLINADIWEEER